MRWKKYVDSLPLGIDSYPTYTAKAAITRMVYDAYGKPELDPELPEVLRQLALHPPPVSNFIPEAHMRALLFAIADAKGVDDETFVRDSLSNLRAMFGTPMWKALFWLISPERVFKNAASRWAAFHRGIAFDVVSIGPGRAEAITRAPPFLDPLIIARTNVMGLQAALEAAGGKDVTCSCTQVENGVTQISARWK